MYVCMYVSMYVCMYVCMYIQELPTVTSVYVQRNVAQRKFIEKGLAAKIFMIPEHSSTCK